MNQYFDEITLSSYVDGELDSDTMREVETFIEKDSAARNYVIHAIKTTARLRASLSGILHEEIPEYLVESIRTAPKKNYGRAYHHMFRLAAAIALIMLGYGAGSLILPGGKNDFSTMYDPLPANYSQVVNDALEYNLSGTPRQWQSKRNQVRISVVPVKTYRDNSGQYFQEFQLYVVTESGSHQINGLAYRIAKGKWKTKAVFYQ